MSEVLHLPCESLKIKEGYRLEDIVAQLQAMTQSHLLAIHNEDKIVYFTNPWSIPSPVKLIRKKTVGDVKSFFFQHHNDVYQVFGQKPADIFKGKYHTTITNNKKEQLVLREKNGSFFFNPPSDQRKIEVMTSYC